MPPTDLLSAEWLQRQGFAPGQAPAGNRYWIKTIENTVYEDGVSWTRVRVHEPDDRGHWPVEVVQGHDERHHDGIAVLLNLRTTCADITRLIEAMGFDRADKLRG